MPISILATKLYIPSPRAGIVTRARLIEQLNEGLAKGHKLTLISAPAGFGKTTLISEWIASSGRRSEPRVAWLSLEEGDSDLVRFISYLIAALQTTQAGIGAGLLAALQSPQPLHAETMLTTLINEIAAITDNFIFVLDDYHTVDAKSINDALAFLIEHQPPCMHLVVATREDPPLPLARYRARGQLTELRGADLRFTPTEAADFLNQTMGLQGLGLNLSAQDIAALENRTEGWIAGLQLAAIALRSPLPVQNHQETASFIQSFTGSHRYVLDYLVEEVLQRQSEEMRSFLLQTAILDQLCAPLCDALTGRADGKAMLDALERGNLFLLPLDDRRQWYRYHHLFAEVLQAYLVEGQPERVTVLHRRASEWYENSSLPNEAIHHALAARDFERAADLIELVVPKMRRNRQESTHTELGWLKALPDELVPFRPVLSVAYAYALFGSGELEAVEARLQDAERWLDKAGNMPAAGLDERLESQPSGMVVVDKDEFRRLPGMIALLRTAQALARGDMPETVKNARRVLDLAPENDYLMRGGAASTLGLAAWASGDLDAARRMTADGMANVRLASYTSPAIGGAIALADIQIAQGRLHEAMTTYEQGLQWATAPGAPVLRGAADMYVGLSSLYYERNDLKTATQFLLTSQALGELAGLPQNPYRWCAAMARIREAQGNLDGALDLLDQAERLYNANFSPNVRPIATRKTRVWLAQGRLGDAQGWAREQGLSVENELSYLHEFDHITLARVLLACYQSDRAQGPISGVVRLLERLLKAAEEGGRKGSVIEIRLLQAIADHAQGNLPAALLSLQHALALAEPEGYVRIFLDQGSSMMQLLREAAARNIMPDYTGKLLAAFEAEQRKSEDKSPLPPTQPMIEPLSQRELEILRLITLGLSNREIGERLFLALDTVKGHNRKIFDKLQVQSRTEAVARARELGLL